MTNKSLIKKLNLSDGDFEVIRSAVAAAESKTTGEIAVAVTAESDRYSFWELLWANILSALVLVILLPFSDKILSLYQRIYWNNAPAWTLTAFFLIVCFIVIMAGFYLGNIPAVDRLIIPRMEKSRCVSNRAMRCFAESGVYETKEQSGILIFVSYMEREVRIIADKGIAAKISQDLWNLIADDMCADLKKGDSAKAFVNAIEKCGKLLEENFPAHEENPNELPDGLVIVE